MTCWLCVRWPTLFVCQITDMGCVSDDWHWLCVRWLTLVVCRITDMGCVSDDWHWLCVRWLTLVVCQMTELGCVSDVWHWLCVRRLTLLVCQMTHMGCVSDAWHCLCVRWLTWVVCQISDTACVSDDWQWLCVYRVVLCNPFVGADFIKHSQYKQITSTGCVCVRWLTVVVCLQGDLAQPFRRGWLYQAQSVQADDGQGRQGWNRLFRRKHSHRQENRHAQGRSSVCFTSSGSFSSFTKLGKQTGDRETGRKKGTGRVGNRGRNPMLSEGTELGFGDCKCGRRVFGSVQNL